MWLDETVRPTMDSVMVSVVLTIRFDGRKTRAQGSVILIFFLGVRLWAATGRGGSSIALPNTVAHTETRVLFQVWKAIYRLIKQSRF